MRGSGFFGLAMAVVGALVIADLWRNKAVTNKLINTGYSESKLVAGR